MTAKEMFEALGYEYKEKENDIVYTFKIYKKWKIFISKLYPTFRVSLADTSLSKSDMKAITQQMKELGWIDDVIVGEVK